MEDFASQMPGGFFVYRADQQEEILYVNDVTLDIFGCDTEEQFRTLTRGTFGGLVHPDDLEAVRASIDNQVASDKRQLDFVEYRITRLDGAVRWVDDYGRLVRTKDYGEVYYVLIRDITELHESRDENTRRAEVIEGLSVDFSSIYLLNLKTGGMRPYRLQNETFQTIASELGREKPDWRTLLPIYAERYIVEEDRERYLREIDSEHIRGHLAQTRSYTVEYRMMDGDNGIRYMQMSVVMIGDGPEPLHAVMGYRDITEHTLRVQRETAEKLNMELALEREKNANEVKSEFLFNLSHDIRTPMNAIMGFTDLAKRHIQETDKLKEYLGKVDESSRHLLSLIDDLLEMSQLEYGRAEMKLEACDIREQIDMTLDMFRAEAERKGLTLAEDLNLPEGQVSMDASRFRRVLGNLLDNAVKFTPAGGTVTVSAKRLGVSESGYARYEFAVADTGVGISEEFKARLYREFEREETSTRSGGTGTGLGLAIAKRLLDMMGGSIAVESTKGQGTTFTVDLPLKLAEAAKAPADAGQPPAPAAEEHRAVGQRRILLVEDIEINRMLAETILEEAGFLVESAPDGCDAVDMVRDHPEWYYDLVLMDIQMPVMNGYEATRAIRALNRTDTKALPIIALSANSRAEDKRMSIESGMNSHMAKPFDVAHLISTVNGHIAETVREA
ncbi:MAG: response regulator [Oscillibacter sp.]|nr:response regulator [Oscillibacter sp.]